MDDALQRYKSGNLCQEPPIEYISISLREYTSTIHTKELFFIISVLVIVPPWPGILPFHQAEDTAVSLIPYLPWHPWRGWRMSNLMLQQFLPTTWSPLPAMRDWSADRGTGHHQTQESNTCWNPIAAWGCHIICCRQHNIVCRLEESRDHSSAKTSSQSSFTRWDLFTGLNCRPPTLVFYSCFGNCVRRPTWVTRPVLTSCWCS